MTVNLASLDSGEVLFIGSPEGKTQTEVFPVTRDGLDGLSLEIAAPLNGNKCVSRDHCSIMRVNDTYWVMDKGSMNGTFVEGERLYSDSHRLGKTRSLKDGYAISLCPENKGYILRFKRSLQKAKPELEIIPDAELVPPQRMLKGCGDLEGIDFDISGLGTKYNVAVIGANITRHAADKKLPSELSSYKIFPIPDSPVRSPISTAHFALIHKADQEYIIIDLSKNGTYIGSQPVTREIEGIRTRTKIFATGSTISLCGAGYDSMFGFRLE